MNKYTYKIKTFLDNNLSSEYHTLNLKCKQYDTNEIIKKFINIFAQNNNEADQLTLIKSEKIRKLHSYEDESLLYIILSDIYGNKYFNDQCGFYEWIRLNMSKINITDDIFSDYHQILFNPCENRKELHKIMYESIFVSADILHHSESEDLNYKIYSNSNTQIHIYHPDSNNGPDINVMMSIINFYRTLLNSDIHVKISVFYGEHKKLLPVKETYADNFKPVTLCSDNINSGSSIKHEIVQIWRKEEFYKVLIHELVHYFAIDFYLSNGIYNKINEHFKSLIKINGIDRINESYTEVLTMVIHSCLYATIHNETFSDIFAYEMLFSYFQTSKILHYFECENYEQVLTTTFNQTTSAFSYYIIKCMFMVNLGKILDFWNTNDLTILKSKQTQENYIELYKEIVSHDTLDANLINKIIQIIKDLQANQCFLTKTMRMSMFQI